MANPPFVNVPQNVINALTTEENSSALFKSLMQTYATTQGARITLATKDHPGTHYDPNTNTIYIDPNMLPGSGRPGALANYAELAVALAHELGHAVGGGSVSVVTADTF